ncbi:GIY-YIG nuclease family protein [Cytobacillus gottheilii]|uniref:GIY-YIG nuclease family protein n=1 Tax=Cytobacillus gottheilii TaxID=859144 RepID=UPI000831E523|nr:GIY-YIG nuclease family protein [Cytobacillus gottheilii]
MINITIPNVDLSFSVSGIYNIPNNMAGLYLFYNDENVLMYVGQTRDLRTRIKLHLNPKTKTSSGIYHNFKWVEVIFEEDDLSRELYETYMINTLKPLLNFDKVITYKTSRYDNSYNLEIKELNTKFQTRLDAALKKFYL